MPIKDSLQEFEMNIKSVLSCLKQLLESDEDLLALLLTEKALAKEKGTALNHNLHEHVELLFEEYARQLNMVLNEVHYLLQRVQSKQVTYIEISSRMIIRTAFFHSHYQCLVFQRSWLE